MREVGAAGRAHAEHAAAVAHGPHVVRVACVAVAVAEVLVRGLVGAGEVQVEGTQPAHEPAAGAPPPPSLTSSHCRSSGRGGRPSSDCILLKA